MNPLLFRQWDFLLLAGGSLLLFGCIHRWLWRGRPNGAVPHLTWLLVLTVLGSGWFFVEGSARRERERMQQMVEGYAPTYAQEMALLGHAEISPETAADDPRYLRMIAAQKRWLAANRSINDIYTFRKLPDGRVALIVDSETDYDRNGSFDGEREKRTAIGEVYDGDLKDVIDALLAGQPVFQAEPSTDRWGTWVTAAVPLRNARGEVEAALGVDFDATTWVAAIAQARHRALGYLAVLLLFIAVGSGWTAHREMTRDFHGQLREQESLRLQQKKLETLVNSIDGVVWEADARTFAFTFVSQQCERLLGYPQADWMTAPDLWKAKLHPEDQWAGDCCAQMVAARAPYHCEYRMIAADGRIVWIRESAAVMLDDAGAPQLVRGVFRDITAQKRAAGELEETHRALVASSHAAGMAEAAQQQATQKFEDLDRLMQALQHSEERLSQAFDACPLPIAILRLRDHGCVVVNRAFLTATGYGREEVLGRSPWDTGLDIDAQSRLEAMTRLASGQPVHQRECRIRAKTGGERAALLWIEPFALASGPHLLAIVQDVSEQRKLETQLRQAQKMEAVGHLAAGIAHDLNNTLTVIEGHTSLHLAKPGLDPRVGHSLRQIQSAGERAAALTHQLLAFSRKQVMQKRAVGLGGVVAHLADLLRRLIPESIALRFDHPPELPPVYADVGNLEQIIINLALNARDAMPAGGTMTIRTDTAEITPRQAALSTEARAGHFVRLTVSDTGEGMSAETMSHIFEPFFTTKEVGKGTGMGLATVLGIVQQHEGWIETRSTPGQGSAFQIHLPVTERAEVFQAQPVVQPPRDGASEVILLVEDDADVRALARGVLEDTGYRVLEAADGPLAIAAWRAYSGRIDLLLSDMVMPGGLSGSEVAARFQADRPESKVLISSGYNVELFGGDLSLRADFHYLSKPYLSHQLLDAVARTLAGTPFPEPAAA